MPIISAFLKLLTNENRELAKTRLKICHHCPERMGVVCGKCFCFLKAKTRDKNEECPLGKWEKSKAR